MVIILLNRSTMSSFLLNNN